MKKRVGRFEISQHEIYVNPGQIQGIMKHCIIVRAESMFDRKVIEYTALSLKFDEVDFGGITPDYKWVFRDHDWFVELLEGE